MRLWSVAILVAFAALGCGARVGARAARAPDPRSLARLEQQAQSDMLCRVPLHVLALDTRAYQVDGCGQMREYAWVCAGRRCSFQPIVPAIIHASADLQCAPDQLTGSADAPTHRAFFGCMRGVAYSLLCVEHGCVWSRTPETVTMTAPTPPPPTIAAQTAVEDPALAAVVIPPPPGGPSAFDPPPPASVPSPPPASTTGDSLVIPPPPR